MSEIQNDKEESVELSEEVMEGQSEGSSDGDQPIWPRRRHKRRKRAYLDFTRVARTFPDVSTDIVCKLAEMAVVKPSNVLKLVPEATTAQIAEFLRIAEKDNESGKVSTTDLKEDIAQLEWLKKGSAECAKQAQNLPCPTDMQFMKDLGKLVPPKDRGNEGVSVQFSEKFQEKILGLLGSANPSTDFDSEHFEKVFAKLAADPLARSRIENLHAARAHKYGHAHFGP